MPDVEFVESSTLPVCPYCEAELPTIDYRLQKLSFGGFLDGFTWAIVLTCPQCRKLLGTQSRG